MKSKPKAKRRGLNINITDFSKCYFCHHPMEAQTRQCPECKFPQRGTKEQQVKYFGWHSGKTNEIEEARANIKFGRAILFGIGILLIISSIFSFINYDFLPFPELIFGGIFIGLGFWSFQNADYALKVGLGLFVLGLVLNGVLNPDSVLNGLVMKGVIFGSLLFGIRQVEQLKKMERALVKRGHFSNATFDSFLLEDEG